MSSKPGHLPVVEIFYTLRGEGYHSGTAATFIRLGTCNLACPSCDTEFSRFSYIAFDEIQRQLRVVPSKWVVFTGGEPTLWEAYISDFNKYTNGVYLLHLETNGTHKVTSRLYDYISISPKVGAPKAGGKIVTFDDLSWSALADVDEWKLICGGGMISPLAFMNRAKTAGITQPPRIYVQPWMDEDYDSNLKEAITLCLAMPETLRLSTQIHKTIGVR